MYVPQDPREIGIPHDKWRPKQKSAMEWLDAQRGWVLAEMPTGSGKTALATGLAHERSVMSLVATKALQEENYRDGYDFDILMGSGNYPCMEQARKCCNECAYVGIGSMNQNQCPSYNSCKYVVARRIAKKSAKASLNYAYYLSAEWPRAEPAQILICDEADELPRFVIDHAGCIVGEKQRLEWDLPIFPRITGRPRLISRGDPLDDVIHWLEQAHEKLKLEWKRLRENSNLVGCHRCELLYKEVSRALSTLEWKREGWYVRSGNGEFFCKPLTAKYHFPDWFGSPETTILMSATVGGDGQALANALGIRDYAFLSVPNRWPVEQRPILIPADVPRIGGKATQADYEHQADLVAAAIKDRPGDWSGLILVTSKVEAKRVADRLARRGLQDRVWLTPEKHADRWAGTDVRAALWQEEKQKRPGALCITWNFWRGYNGLEERILIAMKTPFSPRGEKDSYENERIMQGGGLYHWEAANKLAQGCGRTRRGRAEDYGPDAGLVMVADGNWRMVKKHLPVDFLEAVVQ